MKQKIYQLSQIFFAFLLLLLATNCSQDNFSEIESIQSQDEIQSLEQSPYVLDVVRLEDVPNLNDIIFGSSNRGSKFQSVEGQPSNEVSPVFDTQSIMKVTDTLGFSNYSVWFSIPDRPERVFYNLIVGQQADGNFVNPYVLRYVSDSLSYDNFKKNGYDLSFFKGKVSVHSFDAFFSQETSIGDLVKVNQANSHKNATALPTQCPIQLDEFGDPVPCIIDVVSGGTTGGGGGDSTGGGAPSQSGNACTILGEWHDCGGSNGHIPHSGDVCGGDGLGAFWVIKVFCQEKQMRANNRYGAANAVGDCADCTINTSGGIGVNGGNSDLISASPNDIQFLSNLVTDPVWKAKKGIVQNRPALAYSAVSVSANGILYLLDNGMVLYETNSKKIINSEFESNLNPKFTSETSQSAVFYYLNNPAEGGNTWYEFKLPPPTYSNADMTFLFNGFLDVTKMLGRYVLPVEDIIILIDGKDLDGLEANRALAGGMLVVSIIPGGKVFKPLSKFLKNGIITLSFVKNIGGKMVAQAVGEAVNVEIRAIQRDGFIFYKNVFGEEVARVVNNVFVVTRHKILPKEGSVFFREAFEVNDIIKRQSTNPKLFQPPFKEVVTEFVTEAPEQFVRLHGDGNQISSWIMKASEVKGLSLEQIIEKFALPLEPNQITKASFVNVPTGTKLYAGKANSIFQKTGGGYQFYIDRLQISDITEFQKWFSKPVTVSEFLKN